LILQSPDFATEQTFKMKGGFFKNYRVYLLTSVAYMGSLLFGMRKSRQTIETSIDKLTFSLQVMTRV
jgi:hypothetical protein